MSAKREPKLTKAEADYLRWMESFEPEAGASEERSGAVRDGVRGPQTPGGSSPDGGRGAPARGSKRR